jgi:hypothetical protein
VLLAHATALADFAVAVLQVLHTVTQSSVHTDTAIENTGCSLQVKSIVPFVDSDFRAKSSASVVKQMMQMNS